MGAVVVVVVFVFLYIIILLIIYCSPSLSTDIVKQTPVVVDLLLYLVT